MRPLDEPIVNGDAGQDVPISFDWLTILYEMVPDNPERDYSAAIVFDVRAAADPSFTVPDDTPPAHTPVFHWSAVITTPLSHTWPDGHAAHEVAWARSDDGEATPEQV